MTDYQFFIVCIAWIFITLTEYCYVQGSLRISQYPLNVHEVASYNHVLYTIPINLNGKQSVVHSDIHSYIYLEMVIIIIHDYMIAFEQWSHSHPITVVC